MTSRRARERANARPWEAGEQPEPDNWTALARRHAGGTQMTDTNPGLGLNCMRIDAALTRIYGEQK